MVTRFSGIVALSTFATVAMAVGACGDSTSSSGPNGGPLGEGGESGAATTGGNNATAGSNTAGGAIAGSATAGSATAGSAAGGVAGSAAEGGVSNGGSPDMAGAGGLDQGEGGMDGGGGEGGEMTDLCAGNTCSGHGDCDDASGAAACTCDTGYAGAACAGCDTGYQDKDINGSCTADCASAALTCGHGACDDTSGTASCACEDGYAGAACAACDTGYQDNDINGTCLSACANGTCGGHGTCADAAGPASCTCDAGYAGASCGACDSGYVAGANSTCVAAPDTVAIRWSDSTTLGAADVAGFVPVANWNNALGAGPGQGDNGTKSGLKNRNGLATSVGVTWASQDVELTTITGGGAGDQKMMGEGIRSWLSQGNASLTFTGLGVAFPGGYRMVIHVGRGGGFPTNHSANFTLTAGTDAAVTGKVMPVFDGTWDRLTGGSDAGNYYLSGTQSADSATVSLAATGGATLPTAAINGIEFIPATQAVSINWSDSVKLGVSESAGFVPFSNWNAALGAGPGQGDNGTKSNLVDQNGTPTTVGVTWASQDVELTTITGGGAGDQKMMAEGIRSWLGQGNGSLTLSGLSASFPTGYHFVVYVGRGGGFPSNHSANFNLTAGTDAALAGSVMPTFDGTWNLLSGAGDQGNYYTSGVQTADTATIGIAATGNATLPTAAINGLSIVPN